MSLSIPFENVLTSSPIITRHLSKVTALVATNTILFRIICELYSLAQIFLAFKLVKPRSFREIFPYGPRQGCCPWTLPMMGFAASRSWCGLCPAHYPHLGIQGNWELGFWKCGAPPHSQHPAHATVALSQ